MTSHQRHNSQCWPFAQSDKLLQLAWHRSIAASLGRHSSPLTKARLTCPLTSKRRTAQADKVLLRLCALSSCPGSLQNLVCHSRMADAAPSGGAWFNSARAHITFDTPCEVGRFCASRCLISMTIGCRQNLPSPCLQAHGPGRQEPTRSWHN